MSSEKLTFIGKADHRGKAIVFGIKPDDRTRHTYVIGKTGMGKSTLLENMAVQDINNGNGMCFIDPHGSTAEKLLEYIPESRINDVIYLAPFDAEFPFGLNVLEKVEASKRHLVANGLMSAFKKIFKDQFSSRMEYILNNIILALLENDGQTLLGVNRMLTDKDYRKQIVENVTDPMIKDFWTKEYANYTDKFAQEAAPAIQNKVGQFIANPLIRNIIGQKRTSFDLRDAMDTKKIVIVNLSKGRVGEGNANLIGNLLITKIYLAAMSRADAGHNLSTLPKFYFYVDEFQNFANDTFASILSEARKYNLGLTVAHQYIEQMEDEVKAAVFGNVGTMITFRVGASDAEAFEKEFAPYFTADDIVNLSARQIYLRLMIDGVSSKPFSAMTLPPIKLPEVNNVDNVVAVSRNKYAQKVADVEAEIDSFYKPVVKEVAKKSEQELSQPAKEGLSRNGVERQSSSVKGNSNRDGAHGGESRHSRNGGGGNTGSLASGENRDKRNDRGRSERQTSNSVGNNRSVRNSLDRAEGEFDKSDGESSQGSGESKGVVLGTSLGAVLSKVLSESNQETKTGKLNESLETKTPEDDFPKVHEKINVLDVNNQSIIKDETETKAVTHETTEVVESKKDDTPEHKLRFNSEVNVTEDSTKAGEKNNTLTNETVDRNGTDVSNSANLAEHEEYPIYPLSTQSYLDHNAKSDKVASFYNAKNSENKNILSAVIGGQMDEAKTSSVESDNQDLVRNNFLVPNHKEVPLKDAHDKNRDINRNEPKEDARGQAFDSTVSKPMTLKEALLKARISEKIQSTQIQSSHKSIEKNNSNSIATSGKSSSKLSDVFKTSGTSALGEDKIEDFKMPEVSLFRTNGSYLQSSRLLNGDGIAEALPPKEGINNGAILAQDAQRTLRPTFVSENKIHIPVQEGVDLDVKFEKEDVFKIETETIEGAIAIDKSKVGRALDTVTEPKIKSERVEVEKISEIAKIIKPKVEDIKSADGLTKEDYERQLSALKSLHGRAKAKPVDIPKFIDDDNEDFVNPLNVDNKDVYFSDKYRYIPKNSVSQTRENNDASNTSFKPVFDENLKTNIKEVPEKVLLDILDFNYDDSKNSKTKSTNSSSGSRRFSS